MEEITKVKQEWEEQQKRKNEREVAKKKEKDDKEKADKEKEEEKGKDSDKKPSKALGSLSAASSTPPSPPTHQRFSLHRDIFALRLSEHRKRRQAAQTKLLAPRLPGAPSGGLA